ncbi:ChaN family lipoprotein [Gemmatimonas sp.]|uniref:ChaN family lipoprotein n=1 Tax=Gemmatimonas sp. TaxID=1962908 RepID=UPI0039837BD3
MTPSRRFLLALLGSASLLSSACASGGAGTSVPMGAAAAALRVYDSKAKRFVPFSQLAAAAAKADFVFFGEQHDDPATHSSQLAVLAALGERRPSVVVTLEMFERDVQPLVDQYLAGTISEANFLAGSRPWDRYTTDYRPLVELARVRGWRVVAANVPRRLASAVGRRGLALLDTLNAADRRFIAREHICPKDAYYTKFAQTMTGHSAGGGPPTAPDVAAMAKMTDTFYEAQCVKDEAMGEAIVQAWRGAPKGAIVFHVNGAFHSDAGLGTAERARRRAPEAKTVVLSAVPIADVSKANGREHADKGDYILFTRAPK